ncbi:OmpA family protein [Saccharothrix syringae]|uniref:OmpA-like domain-containing protein n=1 Tax=Saccharothrix syringae TaxID=103733 RepID=A0A5Q0GX39_SACSY|nr:hypothetical protein [Saccharothrix syringae]QFZ18104.1 hypothetical protein EKG83_11985 [Saccharothrix syringae]
MIRADEVVLVGEAGDDAEREALVEAVRGRVDFYRVTDLITLTGERLPASPGNVVDLLLAAARSGVTGFAAGFSGQRVDVSAVVAGEGAAEDLRRAVRRVFADGALDVEVRTPEVGPLDVAALQRSVTNMVQGGGGFRFEPGTTGWEGYGPVLVGRVGRLLLVAPRSTITLVGHASTERPDARDLALARVGVVRDLFVAQGVRPDQVETSVSIDAAPEGADPVARQVDVLIR